MTNFQKAHQKWTILSWVLTKTGVKPKVAGGLALQGHCTGGASVGSEGWVVSPTMLHALAGFHHQKVAHRVTNHLPQHDQHGCYLGISPPFQTGQFFHHEGIHPRTIADYIASCLIFNLCTQAQPPFTLQLPASDNKENTPSASPMQSRLYRWWTQPSSSESAPPVCSCR